MCVRVSFLIKLQASICNFIKKETPTHVFSCEFCELFKNTYFIEHIRVTAFEAWSMKKKTHTHIEGLWLKFQSYFVYWRCISVVGVWHKWTVKSGLNIIKTELLVICKFSFIKKSLAIFLFTSGWRTIRYLEKTWDQLINFRLSSCAILVWD